MTDAELLDAIKQAVKAEIAPLESRLTALEQKVDDRLRETRPIWQAVLTAVERLEAEFAEVKRDIRILHQDMLKVRNEQLAIEDRLTRIEDASAPTERS